MKIAENIADIRKIRESLRGTVGVVLTMGALHAGHMALVKAARAEHQHVIATIFINPTQFGPGEDLDAYPRDLEGDIAKLNAAGVDAVFMPTPAMMYPAGYQTYVTVEGVSQGLEGGRRPGHFRGVATVVTKLFNLTQPTVAYFGQKDAQQVVVIRRLVADLNLPLQIAVLPTERDTDGLALSSRNAYLDAEQRAAAPNLYRALGMAAAAYDAGERDAAQLERLMSATFDALPLADVDYTSVVDARTLQPPQTTDAPLLASLTVRFGSTRLLDNALLPIHLNTRAGLSDVLGDPAYTEKTS